MRVDELYVLVSQVQNRSMILLDKEGIELVKTGFCKVETKVEVVLFEEEDHVAQIMKKHYIYVDYISNTNIPYEDGKDDPLFQ